jgi:hypothetical protein
MGTSTSSRIVTTQAEVARENANAFLTKIKR